MADADNNRLQVFTADGQFLATVGSYGTGPGTVPTTRSASRSGTTGSSMSPILPQPPGASDSAARGRDFSDHSGDPTTRRHKERSHASSAVYLIPRARPFVIAALAQSARPRPAQQASPGRRAEGGALYTFDSGEAGFFTKTYFYDTGSEVVAFDAQFTPELAEAAIASLREQTDNPITYLVITHPNPDKFNGAPAFQEEGAEVIASEATEAAIPGVHEYKKAGFVGMGMFTEETYPQQATVDETFTGTHTLELVTARPSS